MILGGINMKSDVDFQKVQPFLEDILVLHGVSKKLGRLLFELIPFLNQQNQIIINAYLKKELALKIKTSKGTIDNSISKLNEVGLLLRIDRGTYTFHPLLFNMEKLLKNKSAKIIITYSDKEKVIDSE